MKKLRRIFLWFWLLSKRLLRRPAYLAVLLLMPLFALALTVFARQESGVMTVALLLEEPRSAAAEAAAGRLCGADSLLRCRIWDDEEAAREALRGGRIDAVWIFSGDMERQLERFARRGHAAAVTVIEREENVLTRLSREKLFAALYPELSYAVFADFLTGEAGELPEDALRRAYAGGSVTETILRFETLEGETPEEGYLVAPLRGILALLLVLCGMASGLYAYREERAESFVWLPAALRGALPLLCHLTAMLPAALAMELAMALAGVSLAPGREVLLMLLYLPSAALFCELLRCLSPREEHYGALLPLLTAAMLVLCPIFLELKLLRPLAEILPPTRYLRAVWSGADARGLLRYLAALLPLTALAAWLRRRRL